MGSVDAERARIEQAIEALETQRAMLGDEVVRTTLAALRENLAALDQAEKRSLVTVLFADISGYTALSERLDAEDVQDFLGQFWSKLDRTILSHGGQIDKHMGDRVMAVWGLTQPREDDPERAVQAALEMQAELAAIRESLGIQLPMRTGINTGLVSVGHIASTGERNIVGDTVNLASRIERAAPDNGILLSHATYNRVRGLFKLETQPPLSVRGRAEPARTYLVVGTRERTFHVRTRGLAGIITRTVGRDAELALLQTAFHQACSGVGPQWITLSGEAGIGKSRLLTDFERWVRSLAEDSLFLKARAWSETIHSPYHLLRNLMAFRCQISDSDSLTVAREKLRAELDRELGDRVSDEAAAFIGQLIGFDFEHSQWIAQVQHDRKQIRQHAEALMRRYMAGLSAVCPVVILLEDIQWADEQSLSLLAALLSQPQPWKLTVIAAARPLFWDRGLAWGRNSHHQHLELDALTGESASELVYELLQRVSEPPTWLVELLVEQGGGNPYFTEELVNWLIEHGMIEAGEATWQVHLERPWGLSVPGTVQGVLQTRIERLNQKLSAALQRAAVIGLAFWSGAVDHIGREPVPAERWGELCERGLVFRHAPSQIPGEDEFHFKHALLRDVVYEYTLKKQRQALHKRAAEWLTQVAPGRAAEWAAVIAAHYRQAGSAVLAADWYGRAGEQARSIHALQPAIGYFQQALDLLPPPDEERPPKAEIARKRLALYQGLGEMLRLEARFCRAAEAYIGMLAASLAAGDEVSQTLAWHKAFPSLQDAGAAVALGVEDATFGRTEDDLPLAALELNLLGALYQVLGCQGRADPYMEGTLTLLRGPDYQMNEDLRSAISLYDEALTIANKVGNLGGKMLCLTNRGRARLQLQESQEALTDLLETTRLAASVEWFGISETRRLLAEAYLSSGRVTDALSSAKEALSLAEAVEQQAFLGQAWRTLGAVAARLASPVEISGDTYDARACFANSVRILKEAGATVERGRTLLAWATYELKGGDPQQGKTMRQKANRIFAQLGIKQPRTEESQLQR